MTKRALVNSPAQNQVARIAIAGVVNAPVVRTSTCSRWNCLRKGDCGLGPRSGFRRLDDILVRILKRQRHAEGSKRRHQQKNSVPSLVCWIVTARQC